MTENWKCITDTGYEVSDQGRVRHGNRILKGYHHVGNGQYLQVTLFHQGTRTRQTIHRLVLMAFRGAPGDGQSHCNHINANKLDNRLCNLEWVTPRENRLHAQRLGLQPSTHRLRACCSHGHQLNESNTRWETDSRGKRYRACRACARQTAIRYERNRGVAPRWLTSHPGVDYLRRRRGRVGYLRINRKQRALAAALDLMDRAAIQALVYELG